MTRDDKVHALVAQRMQDSAAIREALADMLANAAREGDEPGLIADIAHHVAETSGGVTQAHRESHAARLLYAMERIVRNALTTAAEDETPEDEENDE